MAVNQQQIADELNLSVITVSRALRNHPYLAEATRTRVLKKARELGYAKIPAQAPAPGPVRRAGILFYENTTPEEAPFASGVKRSIFHALQKECQRLHIETIVESPAANDLPMVVKNRTVDVAFVFGRYGAEAMRQLRPVPALAVSNFIDCPDLPRIVADNLDGMRQATEHLIGLGHRKILFVGVEDPRSNLCLKRAEGYLVAMHGHGLAPVIQIYPTPQIPLEPLRGFSAIVCASDNLAYALQDRLEAAGLRLPEDCSLVGFDHISDNYPHIRRKITSYAPDWALMGRMAADLLLSRPLDIHNQGVTVIVPGRLQLHDSTAAPRAGHARPSGPSPVEKTL